MSDTIINQEHIKDFQHISYFLNENNIPITSVTEIIFNDAFFAVPTEEIHKNFNVKLNNTPNKCINWCEIDYINELLKNNDEKIIQILDIIHLPNDEFKTVYYITSDKKKSR
jgi:hypothetical protein